MSNKQLKPVLLWAALRPGEDFIGMLQPSFELTRLDPTLGRTCQWVLFPETVDGIEACLNSGVWGCVYE